jgi:hypothetical protein
MHSRWRANARRLAPLGVILTALVGCSAASPAAEQQAIIRGPVAETPVQEVDPTPAPSAPAAQPQPAPLSLGIPRLGVEVAVVPVGVAVDGQMALPSRLDEAGWYRFGATPGADHGSAVIAGHVDSRAYGIGPLARLRDSQPGDEVIVTRHDSSSVAFVVTSVEAIAKTRLPLGDIFRRDGAPVLRIVTCGGEYSRSAGGYLDNVVVTAMPVTVPP